MIDVFERLAPEYGRIVRKLAIDIWYDRANVSDFLRKANFFRRRYERDLTKYFKEIEISIAPDRIKELSQRWLTDQMLIPRKLAEIAEKKKDRIAAEKMNETQKAEVLDMLSNPREREGKVSRVVAFSDNLEARALQIGEDSAFDLGREINHAAVSGASDTYRWTSQEDSRVRRTHQKLNGKIFSYNSPPTTIDQYGHTHTGNPGADYSCRCYEVPAEGKPLIGYVAKA